MPFAAFTQLAKVLSQLMGWTYFLAWSLSFYNQTLLNYKRKSTSGVLLDFPFLNVIGFIFYFLSTALLYWSPLIRRQYAARNPVSPEPTVQLNDVAFALHAMVLTIITLSMFHKSVWGFSQDRQRQMATSTVTIAWGCLLGVGATIVMVLVQGTDNPLGWSWIDVVYAFGYAKLVITCFKYMPQAWANYQRKSTIGWSIGQIILDVIGGSLSIAQLVLDSSLQADWSGIIGNPVKLMLGNVSMFFDAIFLTQHYVLYPQRESPDGPEAGRLLGEDGRRLD